MVNSNVRFMLFLKEMPFPRFYILEKVPRSSAIKDGECPAVTSAIKSPKKWQSYIRILLISNQFVKSVEFSRQDKQTIGCPYGTVSAGGGTFVWMFVARHEQQVPQNK